MNNENTPLKTTPLSIRQRLIRYLLIGLPLLFLLISLAVSLPLYKQLLAEEDESMKQFAHMMLTPPDIKGILNDVVDSGDVPELTEEQIFNEFSNSLADDELLMPDAAEYAIWSASGQLLNSSFIDEVAPANIDERLDEKFDDKTAVVEQQRVAKFYKLAAKQAKAQKASGFINTGSVFANDTWRVYYAVQPKTGELMVVAQPWQQRLSSLWLHVFEQMMLLLLSLPLLVGLVIWAVHKGLKPINQLANTVEQRHANDLAPVTNAVPKELQPLTSALNHLFQRVTNSIDKEKRFTADASHELKSPITAIKLQANELQHSLMQKLAKQTIQNNQPATANESSDDESLESIEAVQRIQRTANRASHLVDQLLTLTKLTDQDAQDIEQQPINWVSLSNDALQSVSLTAREQGVKLLRHINTEKSDVLPLKGNATLLTLLLRNLLDNAVRYGAGGENVSNKTVELTLAANSIEIRDFGNGIAPEHLERIHERFFRPAGQTQTGSGLGLSIVERIAELHGLRVQIDNHDEGGVRVVVGLPHRNV